MRVFYGVSRASRWLVMATIVTMLASLLPAPAPIAANGTVAAAPFTLILSASGGTVAASPPGPTYAAGTVVTLTPTPASGNVLIKWTFDNTPQGWASPKTITMDDNHRVDALFAPRPSFSDVPTGSASYEAVTQLAARKIINGYGDGTFGPEDSVQRAQIAALIVRAMGWDAENPGGPAPFSDLGDVDPELARAIVILTARGIAKGYPDGTYNPTGEVTHAQAISLIARSMVQAGYWRQVTAAEDDGSVYPNILASSPHRLDILTFVRYAGAIPDRPTNQPWQDWEGPGSRGWTARVLWQSLDSFFGRPGPITSPTPTPSALPSASPSPVPGNNAPVATNDTYTTAEETPLTVPAPGVLANDSDPDGNPITATLVAGPAHGTVTLNANGSFTYTPIANYNGQDSFTYTVTDGNLSSNTATVAVTVSAVNDPPVNSVPSAQGAVANTALVFSIVNSNALSVSDIDAGTSPVEVTLTATNGTVTLSGTAGLSFSSGDGTADPTMTFTGTIAAINTALNGARFDPTAAYVGPASLRIVTNDQGNTGAGGPLSDDDTVAITVTVGAAATIAIVSGNGGTDTVGTTRTLQAKVTDATNTPVSGYTVTWGIATGGGNFAGLPTTTSITDGNGIASIVWTLGTTAGAQSATANTPGLTGSPLTFALAATPDVASLTTSTITANPTAITAGGAGSSTITVQLKDQYGNSLTTSGGTVTLTTSNGTLSGNGAPGATVTAIDSGNGTYIATLAAPNTAGAATVTGQLGGSNLSSSATVTFTAGSATKYILTATSSTVTVGTSVTITAQLADVNNNPVATSGLSVNWSSTNGGSFVPNPSTTDASGIATVSFTVSTVAGTTHTVTASDGTASGTSGTITTVVGAAAQLAFTQQPTNTVAGVAIAPAVQVTIRDSFGNTVTNATSSISISFGSNPGSGTLGGTTATSAVSGVATFANLNINRTGTGYTLVASATGLTSATSNPFNITPGAPATFTIEDATLGGPIQTQTAGSAFTIRITALDASGNIATGFTGTVDITSNGTLSAGGGTTPAFTGGVLASHSVTFSAGGSNITLTVTQTGGTAFGTSNLFTVQSPPTAVADRPANDATSPGGDAYHGFYNQTFTANLLANDILGTPVATLTAFQVAGTPYSGASIGTPQSVAGGHTLTVGANGDITFVPASGFTGIFTFDYTISNGTSSTANVQIAIGTRPAAVSDNYSPALVGNVPINTATSTGFSIGANDAGDGRTYTLGAPSNGTATINANGTFTFRPAIGYSGPASFTYTVTNGFGASTSATVSLTVETPIWFINVGAVAGGDGRYDAPFNDLTSFAAINNGAGSNPAPSDRIFLYSGAYAGPVTLLGGQYLIGQGATTSLSAIAIVSWPADAGPEPTMGAAAPTVVATNANAVTLNNAATGNTLRGFTLGDVGATGIALTGTNFGTLDVSEVTITTNGQGLNLTNGTLNGSFAGVTSTGGTSNISLSGIATTGIAALGTSINTLSGASGASIVINGQGGSFTYSGAIVNTTGTLAADIKNKTGGSVTLAGTINAAAAGRGLSVTGNSAGTIAFSGSSKRFAGSSGTLVNIAFPNASTATVVFAGGGLDIAGTATAVGFKVVGVDGNDGTIAVQGANNVVVTASGTALDVRQSNIGAPAAGEGGLNFRSISANGAANGIVLDNTGTTGGLTVAGNSSGDCGGQANTSGAAIGANSADCTGGTIQGVSGADEAVAGNGIYLNRTRDISLTRMRIGNAQNFAIRGTNVTNLTLLSVLVDGTNGTNANPNSATDGDEEGGVSLSNLSGVASISNSSFSGGIARNFQIVNGSGTLNRVTFDNNQFGLDSTNFGSDSLFIQADNDANRAQAVVLNATVQNNRFTGSRGDLFQLSVRGTGQMDLSFTGNLLSNNHPNISSGGGGVTIGAGGGSLANPINPILTYNIADNSFRDAVGPALSIGKGGVGAGAFSGTVTNNTFGVSGVANSGSAQGSAIAADVLGGGSHTITVTNNRIYQFTNYGILLQAGTSANGGGQGYLTATVTGNTIAEPSPAAAAALFPTGGIRVVLGTVTGDNPKACITVGGTSAAQRNSLSGTGTNGGADLRLFQRYLSILGVPGYTGANNDNPAMDSFLTARNTLGTVNSSNNTGAGGPGYSGTCPAP